MNISKKTIAIASLIIATAANAAASAPPVDNRRGLSFQDNAFASDSGFLAKTPAIGSFKGMRSIPESAVEIDLDRIAKRNGDSDLYIFWLVTNSNYASLTNAFKSLAAQGRYKIAKPAHKYQTISELEVKCQRNLDGRNIQRQDHLYQCGNTEMGSDYRGPTEDPVNEMLPLGDFLTTGAILGRSSEPMQDFKQRRRMIGFAYLALYNAATIAATGSPSEEVLKAERLLNSEISGPIYDAKRRGVQNAEIGATVVAINSFFDKIGIKSNERDFQDSMKRVTWDFNDLVALHATLTGESLAGFVCRLGDKDEMTALSDLIEKKVSAQNATPEQIAFARTRGYEGNIQYTRVKTTAEINADIKKCSQS